MQILRLAALATPRTAVARVDRLICGEKPARRFCHAMFEQREPKLRRRRLACFRPELPRAPFTNDVKACGTQGSIVRGEERVLRVLKNASYKTPTLRKQREAWRQHQAFAQRSNYRLDLRMTPELKATGKSHKLSKGQSSESRTLSPSGACACGTVNWP